MTKPSRSAFEIATWYDTWNQTGLDNLVSKKVPLGYATRYNLAFGELAAADAGGYTVKMTFPLAGAVQAQILAQAPGVVCYAGLGDTGLAEAVLDNQQHANRSTTNIVAWLRAHGYGGISIDAEGAGMDSVAALVSQLGPSFRAASLGIAVSAPWPGRGPVELYGAGAVQAFNEHVDAVELQDYSAGGTPADVPVWTRAGIEVGLLMGGACTENGIPQTSLEDTRAWTAYALQNGLRGMFSWRLDNDHGTHGKQEDVDPTFTGARTIHETVNGVAAR